MIEKKEIATTEKIKIFWKSDGFSFQWKLKRGINKKKNQNLFLMWEKF